MNDRRPPHRARHEVYRIEGFIARPCDIDGQYLTVDAALEHMQPLCPSCGAVGKVRHAAELLPRELAKRWHAPA
jgi:hypothetical protein